MTWVLSWVALFQLPIKAIRTKQGETKAIDRVNQMLKELTKNKIGECIYLKNYKGWYRW